MSICHECRVELNSDNWERAELCYTGTCHEVEFSPICDRCLGEWEKEAGVVNCPSCGGVTIHIDDVHFCATCEDEFADSDCSIHILDFVA